MYLFIFFVCELPLGGHEELQQILCWFDIFFNIKRVNIITKRKEKGSREEEERRRKKKKDERKRKKDKERGRKRKMKGKGRERGRKKDTRDNTNGGLRGDRVEVLGKKRT